MPVMSVFTISILSAMCLIRILLHVRPSLLADASLRRDVISGIHWMVGTAIGVILVTTFLVRAFYVPSRSMQPTLMVRDLFLANRLSYWLRTPQVGDIAVFRPLADQAEKSGFMVKRVVAIGGDVLKITDGKLWRNGHAVSESYLGNDVVMADMAQFQVPPGRNQERAILKRTFNDAPQSPTDSPGSFCRGGAFRAGCHLHSVRGSVAARALLPDLGHLSQ